MVAPGALVILSPLVAGILFGEHAVEGLLAGAIVSGVQVAISASNTGGAWDNCKKEIEKNNSNMKALWKKDHSIEDVDELANMIKEESDPARVEFLQEKLELWKERKEMKNAAVVGDTVGDPLKDTSGPAINILVKLSAITSLVFGSYIQSTNLLNKPSVETPAA